MTKARKEANVLINEADKANAYHDTVLPYFDKIRRATDSLELIVDNEMWTLPKYRELLFIILALGSLFLTPQSHEKAQIFTHIHILVQRILLW